MTRKSAIRRRVGDVVEVPLNKAKRRGFGLVLDGALMAFFDLEARAGEEPSVDEIVRTPVAFKVWVMNEPIAKGHWPIIGRVDPIPAKLKVQPWFVLEDQLTGGLSLTKTGAEEVRPKPGQVDKLEMAAVWERSSHRRTSQRSLRRAAQQFGTGIATAEVARSGAACAQRNRWFTSP
jgi:hypothetical protein